jgi:bifunctional NMN adenylyltransferase/nudix hydrolase
MEKSKFGFYMGRFQMIHIGHESIINQALEQCDELLILVGSAQLSKTARNPFNYGLRMTLIEEIYNKMKGEKRVHIGWIEDLTHEDDHSTDWGRFVLDKVNEWSKFFHIRNKPDLMVYGNDEERKSWFDESDIIGIKQLILPRNIIDISATKLRRMIVEDNFYGWAKYTNPLIHSYFDELRNELLNIGYYKEMNTND